MRDRQPGPPRRFADVAELLAGATERTVAGRRCRASPGPRLERVVIGGQPYVLKHLDLAEDWTMRASGCLRGAPLELWERGILGRLPGCFNQPIVAAASPPGPGPVRRLRAADARRDAVAGPGHR